VYLEHHTSTASDEQFQRNNVWKSIELHKASEAADQLRIIYQR